MWAGLTFDDAATAAVSGWLRERGIGSGISDVEPLTGGTQNVVVRLCVGGRRMVLRRPPPHPRSNSNRTMQREIAVLKTLAGSSVPHPEFIAGCEDLDVLGVVFYLMEDVDGFNPLTEVAPAYVADRRMRHQVGLNYAADLARLSAAPWQGRPLEQLHRPGSFLARQVPNFLGLLESYRHEGYRPETLDVGRLAGWLEDHRPPDGEPGIMHGDAHLNNVLLRRESPEVAAFVDWEMCTIGDPLLDLGWILVCWPEDPDPINAGRELAALGGLPTRTELVTAYADAGGRPTEHLDWYVAMACFKLAIVIEGTYSRFLAGQAHREAGERLHDSASRLIGLGVRVTTGDNPFV
ncbi:aminoglycoside phosphotransferase (APT) family kinase protein [Mycolicibacterium sp. BK634]|uniref:phosphotransferase family protein n=1 Tax=Mycobacteriaceae TaxID=1762 RepID=UPI00105B546D|nr:MULTISPECIES: phosphotransferase family protein [Mycobacteriaceae]MBB3754136.1 aminoglycoside phosphotransferase (APT) family kinase protein [Mycolicibacterium sp. BK634]TDO17891.1 aminoglycoside phosphotransferase (APT) family kinase protein [Mycobacterium sp. BK086]